MKTRFIIILFPILFLCISCNPDRNNPARTDLANLFPEKTVTKEGIIGIFQRATLTYSEYKLSNLLQGNIEPIKAITFKENVDQLVPINDNYYIGCGVLENGSACMFDKTGKSVKTYTNTYPDFINNIKNPSDRYINGQQLICFNNKANTLLFASIFKSNIFQFNSEGKPIRSINLDKKILDFCVDEKNQKIYGISLSDELDYVIIEIKI